MNITVEISMYPLKEDYEPAILAFIAAIERRPGLKVKVNALSTQVQGAWDEVFDAIREGAEEFFGSDRGSFVMKLLRGDDVDLDYNHSAT